MKNIESDKRIDFLRQAETGAVTDAMNTVGVGGWMDDIFPASPRLKLSGRAFTIQFSKVRDPNRKTCTIFEVFDQCSPGDIVVVSSTTKDSTVGENMMYSLLSKGLGGMILDGKIRDTGVIMDNALPVFSRGSAIRVITDYKITAVQVPVMCGGVMVEPGDYIVGDIDGVIAIPQARIDDVIYQAEWVAKVELEMEQAIKDGIPTQELIKLSAKKRTPRTE